MNKLKLALLPLMIIAILSFDAPVAQKEVIEFRQASVEEVQKKIESAFDVRFT